MFWVLRDIRITELIRLIGTIGVTSVLRLTRNFSITRAGLREAARVLTKVLWSSGL
jgi:hypothetical protein